MLNTEKYMLNIILRLEQLHLKDLTTEESNAIEVLKQYLQREHDKDNLLRLKVSSSNFFVVCPVCESLDVHVTTVPDEFDDETAWKIEVECNNCEFKGYIESY